MLPVFVFDLLQSYTRSAVCGRTPPTLYLPTPAWSYHIVVSNDYHLTIQHKEI
jgi:hypothetical protein